MTDKTLADRLEELAKSIQEGDRPLPWVVHSGCSYRRIASEPTRENMRSFSDGNVLHATKCWHDGHPDLSMPEDQLVALVEIVNNLPEIIAALRGEERMREALTLIVDPISPMQARAKSQGHQIDGVIANVIARDPDYLKGIARQALEQPHDEG